MVQTRRCDFCGTDIEPGTGTMFVHVDGRVVHFCSSKCEKNASLGRVPRDVEWTAEGQRIREGRRTVGSQEAVETGPEEPAAESAAPAEDSTVGQTEAESDAQAVAAPTGEPGTDSEEAAAIDDERVEAADADEGSAQPVADEEIDEVEGRRTGGTDPDVGENVGPDTVDESAAEASVEDTAHETAADEEMEFDAEDIDRTGDETISQDEADEVVENADESDTDESGAGDELQTDDPTSTETAEDGDGE